MKTEEAKKKDEGKARMDLIPFDALHGVGMVLAFGVNKYAARNWEKGLAWGRLVAALLRHTSAWMVGQDLDPETGYHHLDHVATCALMLSATVKRKIGLDDRRP